jgi:hypothetical protein
MFALCLLRLRPAASDLLAIFQYRCAIFFAELVLTMA